MDNMNSDAKEFTNKKNKLTAKSKKSIFMGEHNVRYLAGQDHVNQLFKAFFLIVHPTS
jgi:hypothetical protein